MKYCRTITSLCYFLALAVCAVSSPLQAENSHPQCNGTKPTANYSDGVITSLIYRLSNLPAASPEKIKALNTITLEASLVTNSAGAFLSEKAKLIQAAEWVSVGKYRRARKTLGEIPLNSTVAIDAGLLFAESWRLEGNHHEAHQWLLRLANTYPADPKALSGLIATAHDWLAEHEFAAAMALFRRAYELADSNAKSSKQLLELIQQQGTDSLLTQRQPDQSTVQQQFIRQAISDKRIPLLEEKQTAIANNTHCQAQGNELAREIAKTLLENYLNLAAESQLGIGQILGVALAQNY